MKKRALSQSENPYRAIPCPICGEFAEHRCRCIGPHDLEQLRKGHGFGCKNKHQWNEKGEFVDLNEEKSVDD